MVLDQFCTLTTVPSALHHHWHQLTRPRSLVRLQAGGGQDGKLAGHQEILIHAEISRARQPGLGHLPRMSISSLRSCFPRNSNLTLHEGTPWKTSFTHLGSGEDLAPTAGTRRQQMRTLLPNHSFGSGPHVAQRPLSSRSTTSRVTRLESPAWLMQNNGFTSEPHPSVPRTPINPCTHPIAQPSV